MASRKRRKNTKKERKRQQLIGQHIGLLLIVIAYVMAVWAFNEIEVFFQYYIVATVMMIAAYKVYTPDILPYWKKEWKKLKKRYF